MLRTKLCDVLGIDIPIIQAAMGGTASSAEFAAAASNEGALGSIGSLFRTTDAIKRDLDLVRELTNRNFAVNHIPPTLDAEAFRHTLALRPSVISFALGDPGDLVRQAHEVGSKVMIQITTVSQAIEAAERGADVIIAQGGESGGYGGTVSTMALVPQVVDAVSPVPVVAAGGIFDGRGMAAAIMLGAVGVNVGTRFLASIEAPIEEAWKASIVSAQSENAVKLEVLNDIQPLPGTAGYGTILRSLRTPFMDEWAGKRKEARREGTKLWEEIQARARAGRRSETLLTAGQTVGGVKGILPIAEIIKQLVAEAEHALLQASTIVHR